MEVGIALDAPSSLPCAVGASGVVVTLFPPRRFTGFMLDALSQHHVMPHRAVCFHEDCMLYAYDGS